MKKNFYQQDVEQVLRQLGTDRIDGLGGDEVKTRQERDGFNEFAKKKHSRECSRSAALLPMKIMNSHTIRSKGRIFSVYGMFQRVTNLSLFEAPALQVK